MASADDEPPASLRRFEPPELEQRITFRVGNLEESNPHEGGSLVIVADPDHIEIHFWGARAPRWKCTWTEMRWLIERIEREKQQEKKERQAATQRRKLTRERLKRARPFLKNHPTRSKAQLTLVQKPKDEDADR